MANSIIVGTQWGDEGKAKVIDYLTAQADVIIRFQGGANAGHTVVIDGKKFIFHLVPSGIMTPSKACVVGNGVVFDAELFLNEVEELRKLGVSVENRLFVSDLANLVLPYHKLEDTVAESHKGDRKIGTTGRGIGPAYAEKTMRTGLRMQDAGLEKVDHLYVSNMGGGRVNHQTGLASAVIDHLCLQPAGAETIENGPASGSDS